MRAVNWNPFLRFPRISLIAFGLVCMPLFWQVTRFQTRSEMEVLLEGDQRNFASYGKVRQVLADVEVAVISLEAPQLFSQTGLEAVRQLSEAFARQPGVEEVKSLTHSFKPVRDGFSFDMVPLVPSGPLSPAQLEELKRFSLNHPLVRNLMVSADGRHTIIMVTYDRDFKTPEQQSELQREIQQTLDPFQKQGFKFQVLALPLIETEIRSALRSDLLKFVPAAIALPLVILWLTFRSWRFVGLVLLNQAAALLIMPGLLQGIGFPITVFSAMLFPLLTGIQLTLLTHVYTAFQRARSSGLAGAEAIEVMLDEVFKPCAFAAITTAVGLLSLTVSEVRPVREFGLLGSIGIGTVFVITFGPGLALLKLVADRLPPIAPGRAWKMGAGRVDSSRRPWSPRWTGFVIAQRKKIFAGAVLVLAVSAVGIAQVRTDIRAVEFLNPESATRQAIEEWDEVYGGVNAVQIEIDSGRTNGINSLPFLKYMAEIHGYAESRPNVSGAYSYAQLVAMINQIWEGGATQAFRLPDNPLLINLFVLALRSQDFPFLTTLSDPSFQTAYLVVRTRDMASDRYLALIRDIVRHANQRKPANVEVSAARGLHSILEADRRILRSQISSAGLTVLVIGAVLAWLWRSPRLAFISLASNAIPVALVLAIAGYCDVPLNSITIMVAAISLGIAVDDSVHFITSWRQRCAQGLSAGMAVQETLAIKSRPILSSSLVLIAVFSMFAVFSFPPAVHFGLLSAGAFLAALVAVMLFLPALLCGKSRPPAQQDLEVASSMDEREQPRASGRAGHAPAE